MQQVPQLHKKRQGRRAVDKAQGLQGRIQEDGQSRENKGTGNGESIYKMHELETQGRHVSAEVYAMHKQPGWAMGLARR